MDKKAIVLYSIIAFLGVIILFLFFIYIRPLKTSPKTTNVVSKEKPSKTIAIISQNKPMVFTNDTNTWKVEEIPQKEKIFNPTTIRIGMDITFNDTTGSPSLGFAFSNGLEETDVHSRAIRIFYFVPNKQWVFGDYTGPEKKHYALIAAEKSKLYESFILNISPNGKSVLILASSGLRKDITLQTSLYDTTNNMKLFAQLCPFSRVSIAPLLISTHID